MREEIEIVRKKFLKEISVKEMIMYLLHRCWIVLIGCIAIGVLTYVVSAVKIEAQYSMQNVNEEVTNQSTYVLIDGNYVYTSLINVRADSISPEIVTVNSYLGLMISNKTITQAIENLGLTENFIDIFNKMSWEIIGENIKLKISSPVQYVDGYTWDQVLAEIVKQGESVVKENFSNVKEIIVIDEPYIENGIVEISSTDNVVQKPTVNMKVVILMALVGGILTCAGLLTIYLFKEDITCPEEIEKNLDVPVLVILDEKLVEKDREIV